MKIIFFLFLMSFLLPACGDNSMRQYKYLTQKELGSGRRVDSIFLGIYFGMPRKQFFLHCWQLNKKGVLTDGKSNTAVLYRLKNNELRYAASMHFFPEFYENKVSRMKVMFNYNDWAPWNKELMSEKLLPDVLKLFSSWYPSGNSFLEIADKERGTIYVKIDGNRRITIGRFDDMHVKADFADLSADPQKLLQSGNTH